MFTRMRSACLASAVLACGLLACAPMQFVPIRVEPAPADVYLDQELVRLEGGGLELRADRPHLLYFKRDGYRPERVVVRTATGEEDGRPRLVPPSVSVRLLMRAEGGGSLAIEEETDEDSSH